MGCFSSNSPSFSFLAIMTLTRAIVLILGALSLATTCSLEVLSFHGRRRSNQRSRDHHLKWSITLWPLPLVSFSGYLVRDLKVTCLRPPVLCCDNQSTMLIAANPVFYEHTKHLNINCHIVRKKLQAGLMWLLPIPSTMQVADLFTKRITLPTCVPFFPS